MRDVSGRVDVKIWVVEIGIFQILHMKIQEQHWVAMCEGGVVFFYENFSSKNYGFLDYAL